MDSCSNALLVTVAVIAVVGCSNAPKQEDRIETTHSAPRAPVAAAQPVTAGVVQETESQKLGRLVKGVEGQSVYFAYDDFTIKNEYRQLVVAHAEVLKKTERGNVFVEGNADERGSREYNLALGQKRAEAVASALKTLGVPPDRIEAVSFGKEKPRALCHEDKCWADNRRVDFTYKLK
jgi:peptidoglycan-associated lipoprotein